MKSEQVALPFRLMTGNGVTEKARNSDLSNQSFTDRVSTIAVIALRRSDPAQVLVRRDLDCMTWTVPASLVRAIVVRQRRAHTA